MNKKGEVATIVFLIVTGFAIAAMVQGRLAGHYADTHSAIGVAK